LIGRWLFRQPSTTMRQVLPHGNPRLALEKNRLCGNAKTAFTARAVSWG